MSCIWIAVQLIARRPAILPQKVPALPQQASLLRQHAPAGTRKRTASCGLPGRQSQEVRCWPQSRIDFLYSAKLSGTLAVEHAAEPAHIQELFFLCHMPSGKWWSRVWLCRGLEGGHWPQCAPAAVPKVLPYLVHLLLCFHSSVSKISSVHSWGCAVLSVCAQNCHASCEVVDVCGTHSLGWLMCVVCSLHG
jgi:hypothetical protein